jgi:hypothetical protein
MINSGRAATSLKIISPAPASIFQVAADPEWPAIPFRVGEDLAYGPQLTWDWQIKWRTFSKKGTVVTTANSWDAKDAVQGLGGALTVSVSGPGGKATVSVQIAGTNPSPEQILAYLATQPDSAGFDKILQHETQMTHFDSKGQPRASFDSGFGMCQLTVPPPAFEQCWSWKLNVDAGLALYAAKRQAASRYLSQKGRVFTADQLTRETVARWNGGAYHVWSSAQNAWIRNPAILCDSKTGNIGWDMSKPDNSGNSEAVLHQRDAAKYRRPPGVGGCWGYFGICYADRLLS